MTAFARRAISWWMEALAAHDSPERMVWTTAKESEHMQRTWSPAREKLYSRKVRPSRMGLNTLVQCGRPQPKRKSLWSASPGMIRLTILHQGVLSTNREAQLSAPHSPQ